MSQNLGPLEVECDAPPYPIVQACSRIRFQSPLDVCWRRLSHYLEGPGERFQLFSSRSWKRLFQRCSPREKTCTCGGPLPALGQYTFTFVSTTAAEYLMGQCSYLLGQCGKCHTIFWEEASPVALKPETETGDLSV